MWPRLFNQTVTVASKIRGTAATQWKDQWFKYVIPGCMWQYSRLRSLSGNVVSYGSDITVRIPKSETDKLGIEFMMYSDWSDNTAEIDRTKYFSVDSSSYLFLGEVTEDITSDNISSLRQQYQYLVPKQVADNLNGFPPHIRVSGV